ncbi:glutathione S-transferase family protein [Pandoraea sp.]|uniref:glutathione S-transferase family protein n=1 Tax=Pandoraea sp. TaxID=1883445 RepID=UPI001218F65A|nr:glutathione S-transferase family protein [Pandoraea sp.]TAL53336.1 MAG: glutathione S-transferase family protein [Pandoraea sp.]TAM20425.1 MAG: glutathione S-transferase family protein [Pandoraea sp.]
MNQDRHITLFHAPNSRSAGARILVEELQAEHDLHVLNLKTRQQREPAYLAINPMGKVPALRHGQTFVSEQAAVYMYLAELYPERGLSPAPGDPLRGAYLRWMVFYGSCFEPAIVDRAMNRDAGNESTSPYGSYEAVVNAVEQQLQPGPWLLGERFTAADALWGSALGWVTGFKLMPASPAVLAYLERFQARPAVRRAQALDAELANSLDSQA